MIEIRVFISCPSGDKVLGDLPKAIIEKCDNLNKYYELLGFRIKPLHWEQSEFVGSEKGKTPQERIYDRIGEYDLYFGMMGSRYGTMVPECEMSQTELEFIDALDRNARTNQYKYPRVVCFSFLKANKRDCKKGECDEIAKFINHAQVTGISKVYENKREIEELFESKLKECIDTAYVKYPHPNEYKISLSVTDRRRAKDAFSRLYQSNLYDDISEGKRILLFGGGGSGKSTYLQYIAYLYSNEIDSFTPIHIKLKLYNAESLEESIVSETRSLPKSPLLLLDGYDELSDEMKLQFHKQLLRWMDGHADAPIVVTSRPIDQSTTPLREFHLYDMSLLSYDQIKQYYNLNHIDESVFTKSNIWNQLYSLLQIPFYLVKIVEFYMMEGSLPTSMSQILEFAIKHGAISDKEHYETSFTADYEYEETDVFLSLLSFCMTNSGKTTVLREELGSIIPDSKIVDFLRKYTRLIESERNQQRAVYSFSHKIFQDYLAAKAICKMGYTDILDIILDVNKEEVRYNWEPTIPFLIEFLQGNDRKSLVKHIFLNQSSLLLEVLPDFLNNGIKEMLFISTFEKYAKTIQYIPPSINRDKLATIWDSSSMEKYLLDFIKNPKNKNYMMIGAFILISKSQMVFKNEIDKTLIECLQDKMLAGYRRSLNNVATIFITIDDFDQSILDELYDQNPRDTIQLLAVYDKSFKYIGALIDLYKEIDRKPRQDQSDSETKQSIEDYLVYCVKSNHIQAVVAGIIKSNLLRDTLCLRDEMKEIMQFAYDNYAFDEIYEDMYRLFVYCIDTGSDGHLAELSVYFIRQKEEYQVVKRIFDEERESHYGVFLVLINPESMEFITSICKDLIPSLPSTKQEKLLKQLANTQIPPLYCEILEQMGISLEMYKEVSIQERRKKRLIEDMNLVLNVDLLIRELDDIFGDDDSITFEYYRSIERYKICTVIDMVMRNYRTNNQDKSTIPKKSIIEILKGNYQSLVLNFVTSNFKKQPCINAFSDEVEIELSTELRKWLNDWKEEILRNTDITIACKQVDSVRLEIDTRVETIWSLVKEDLVEVDATILLDFLSLVWDISDDWSIIEKKINNKQLIRSRVAENLNNKHQLALTPLANHIWFCTNNHYYEVLPHSYDILRRLDVDYGKDEHLRYCCLESIIRLESDQHRFKAYVSDCPGEIMGYLARGYVKERRSMVGLIARLKTEVKLGESEYVRFYLYCLVCMGDFESLHKYIETIKQSQDFYIEYEYPNPFELITDETQLGLLLDLLSFSFKTEIRQSQYHSLTRCILSSVENIAYQSHENYENIIGLLTDLTQQYPGHKDSYILFEYLWKIKEEMPKRTIKLPTLLESLTLYKRLTGY